MFNGWTTSQRCHWSPGRPGVNVDQASLYLLADQASLYLPLDPGPAFDPMHRVSGVRRDSRTRRLHSKWAGLVMRVVQLSRCRQLNPAYPQDHRRYKVSDDASERVSVAQRSRFLQSNHGSRFLHANPGNPEEPCRYKSVDEAHASCKKWPWSVLLLAIVLAACTWIYNTSQPWTDQIVHPINWNIQATSLSTCFSLSSSPILSEPGCTSLKQNVDALGEQIESISAGQVSHEELVKLAAPLDAIISAGDKAGHLQICAEHEGSRRETSLRCPSAYTKAEAKDFDELIDKAQKQLCNNSKVVKCVEVFIVLDFVTVHELISRCNSNCSELHHTWARYKSTLESIHPKDVSPQQAVALSRVISDPVNSSVSSCMDHLSHIKLCQEGHVPIPCTPHYIQSEVEDFIDDLVHVQAVACSSELHGLIKCRLLQEVPIHQPAKPVVQLSERQCDLDASGLRTMSKLKHTFAAVHKYVGTVGGDVHTGDANIQKLTELQHAATTSLSGANVFALFRFYKNAKLARTAQEAVSLNKALWKQVYVKDWDPKKLKDQLNLCRGLFKKCCTSSKCFGELTSSCGEEPWCEEEFGEFMGSAENFMGNGLKNMATWDEYLGVEAAPVEEGLMTEAIAAESGGAVAGLLEGLGCVGFPVACMAGGAMIVGGAVVTELVHVSGYTYVPPDKNTVDDLDYEIEHAAEQENDLVHTYVQTNDWMKTALCTDQDPEGRKEVPLQVQMTFSGLKNHAAHWEQAMQVVQKDGMTIRNADSTNIDNWNHCWWWCGSEPKRTVPEDFVQIAEDVIKAFDAWDDRLSAFQVCASNTGCHIHQLVASYEDILKKFYAFNKKWRVFEKALCDHKAWTFCASEFPNKFPVPAVIIFSEIAQAAASTGS